MNHSSFSFFKGKKKVPSGVKSPQVTDPPWPDSTVMQAPVSAFQSQAVKSSDPASTNFPLGCHFTHYPTPYQHPSVAVI